MKQTTSLFLNPLEWNQIEVKGQIGQDDVCPDSHFSVDVWILK